ncbi:hypothetical protein LVB87_02805 [Lysobacter sp. KIS68-7]|uniref:hypothetical protein n=1 Tax=Lysobacter sp. KIS68-7 TaxID=2904252 RepID=UPI001E6316B0|nr:hypothetical protein [Lysobacter sp. KIS68-7]UHQ20106.1 hypothetical protein LVB87_02805 [Lysobacter sp. KIS68-7]
MNNQFDYVMAPVSIVVGLAIGHILAALGVAVNRLRGHGKPIHLEVVFLSWAAYVLVWIVSFWWWEFKFDELGTTWTYGLYLFVLVYAMVLFLLAVILVPRGMKDLDDSYAWFMADRRWFFSMIIVANVLDILDSWVKSSAWAFRPLYLIWFTTTTVGVIVGMRSESRRVQQVLAVGLLAYQVIYTGAELNVLGRW